VSISLLGNKIGMTQIFDEFGNIVPVTIVKMGPCVVTQIKTKLKDGYEKLNLQPFKYLKEFRVNPSEKFEIGQTLNVESFTIGQLVDITGKSTGKGFSGLQKRHKFSRGPMTHGSKNHRQPGSIGQGTTPGRVFPGKKMAGQLGNKTTKIKKLKIIQVNKDTNILVIKGSVPGKPGNLLTVTTSK
jgi:large subunit ribosomal protein L3